MTSVTRLSRNLYNTFYLALFVALMFLPALLKAQTPDTLWSEKWERMDWTNDWHVDAGTWEVGKPTSGPGKAYRDENCAATVLAGNYPDYADTRLIRHVTFAVPPANEHPRLRFWHWYSFSSNDYGKVQIKVGSGNWQDVSIMYWGYSSVWTYPLIDLSAYAGMTVTIAFFFHAADDGWSGSDVSSGWYIDDVALIKGTLVFNNSENWESGLGDWSPERGTWEVGIPKVGVGPGKAYTGTKCAATVLEGNYTDFVDSRLISPAFTVPVADQNPRLRFWHWYSFSSNDYGKVQIKVGTADWKDISISNWGYCSVWTYSYIDLSAYAGQTVSIAFYIHAADDGWSGSDVSAGWYIDNIALVAGAVTLNNPETWENGLGDWSPERGTWEVGIPKVGVGPGKAYTGTKCAATVLEGNYTDFVDSRLISPAFTVPVADQNPRLRFWHWFSFSSNDYGIVQIKVGTADWKDISISYWGYCSVWTYPYIDLSAYAGKTVSIAFYIHAADDGWSGSDVSAGWYIDDIALLTGAVTLNNLETWENGLGNWNPERGTWEVGIPKVGVGPGKAYTGTKCAATVLEGNYTDFVDSRLVSPLFVVPSVDKNPALRFWHWFSFSSNDYGKIQIKKENSSNWEDLPEGYYAGTSGGIWTYPYITLSQYAGTTVQIAFYFHAADDGWSGSDVSTGWYIDDIKIDGLITAINETSQESDIIKSFVLNQNYPNPFNPETTILYELPHASKVEVAILNLLGEKIRTLADQPQQAGQHRLLWNGRDENEKSVPSGVYFYRLRAGEFVQTRKMILMQ